MRKLNTRDEVLVQRLEIHRDYYKSTVRYRERLNERLKLCGDLDERKFLEGEIAATDQEIESVSGTISELEGVVNSRIKAA